MREPHVAGQFYEEDFNSLIKQIEDSFKGSRGPGILPYVVKKENHDIKAAVVPHAGYFFSGQCSAWAYQALSESKQQKLYIVIGPSHYGLKPSQKAVVSLEDWKTPLGIAKNKIEFSKALAKKSKIINADEDAFIQEHSIEVQLPFLQYISKEKFSLEFVPILVSDMSFDDIQQLADDIDEVSEELGIDVVVIASSDFTHYGRNYGYLPFIEDVKENIYGIDASAINLAKKIDSRGFYEHVKKYNMTICGYAAIAVAMEVSKLKFAKEGKLLCYYTSGDVVGNYRNSVSYASMIFE